MLTRADDFRHGLLPLERPCTENLTPFLALLPCRSRAGLAQLLEPHHVFDSNWQRLGVHVYHDLALDTLELRLEVEIVPSPIRIDQSRQGPGRRGASARARLVRLEPTADWSFQQTFGSEISRRCEPARSSRIVMSLPPKPGHRIRPDGWRIAGDEAVWDLLDGTIAGSRARTYGEQDLSRSMRRCTGRTSRTSPIVRA